MTDKTPDPKPETPAAVPGKAADREYTCEELDAMLNDAEDDVDTAEARVADLEAQIAQAAEKRALRDVVRSQAFAMLAADTDQGVFTAAMAVPFMLIARESRDAFVRGMRESDLDLRDVLDSPAVARFVTSLTGGPTEAAPAAPAVPATPNLIVTGDPGTGIDVLREGQMVTRRVMPMSGTRSIALPPAVYKIGVFPPGEPGEPGGPAGRGVCTRIDLIDPADVVTLDARAMLATMNGETPAAPAAASDPAPKAAAPAAKKRTRKAAPKKAA